MISAVCADDPTHNINKHYIITTAVHQNVFNVIAITTDQLRNNYRYCCQYY